MIFKQNNMKSKNISFGLLLLLLFAIGCSDPGGLDEDTSFINSSAPGIWVQYLKLQTITPGW